MHTLFPLQRMRFVPAVPLLLSVCVVACAGSGSAHIYNSKGIEVGTIHMESDQQATITDLYGQTQGKVRGSLVRNESGGRAGTVVQGTGSVSIRDAQGKEVGMLQGASCRNAEGSELGTVSKGADPEAAGGACLVLLIQKDQTE